MKFFSSIVGALGLCVTYTHCAQDIFLSNADMGMYDYLQNLQNLQQSAEDIPHNKLTSDTLTPDDVAQMETLLSDYYAKQLETDLKSSSNSVGEVETQQFADSVNDAARDTILELAHKSNEELLTEVLQLSEELGIEISPEEAIETASLLKSMIDTQVSLMSSTDETESANLLSNLLDMYEQIENAENEEVNTNVYLGIDEVQMAIDNLQQLLNIAQNENNVDIHTKSKKSVETQKKVYNSGREMLQKLSKKTMKKHTFTPETEAEHVAKNIFVDDSEVYPSVISML